MSLARSVLKLAEARDERHLSKKELAAVIAASTVGAGVPTYYLAKKILKAQLEAEGGRGHAKALLKQYPKGVKVRPGLVFDPRIFKKTKDVKIKGKRRR